MNGSWNFYKCEMCNYRTSLLSIFFNHVRLHEENSKDNGFVCNTDPPENHKCEKCQFQSYLKLLLTNHLNKTHKRKARKMQHYPHPLLRSCKICDFQTYSSLVFLRHNHSGEDEKYRNIKLKNTNFFQCNHCSYKTSKKSSMTKHMFNIHPTSELVNRFKCDRCSFKAKTRTSFLRHMRKQHNIQSAELQELWGFKCEHCSYRAVNVTTLKRHVVVKHTPLDRIEWFQCDCCSYKAKIKSKLQRHVKMRHRQLAEQGNGEYQRRGRKGRAAT